MPGSGNLLTSGRPGTCQNPMLDAYQIVRTPLPPYNWLISNLLERQNHLVLVGRPKRAAKSWLLFNLAVQAASNEPIWGVNHSKRGNLFVPCAPLRVAYFAQEDTLSNLRTRLIMIERSTQPLPQLAFFEPRNPDIKINTAAGLAIIKSALDHVAPIDLLIFDPLRRSFWGDENDSSAIAHMWDSLAALEAHYNCSTILSHHIVKPSQNSEWFNEADPMTARGSGDLFGGADTFINVVPAARKHTQEQRSVAVQPLTLHFETKRSEPISPISLSVSFSTGLVSFEGFAGPGRPGRQQVEE